MTYIKVRNVTRDADLGQKIRVADTLAARMIGLLNTPVLKPNEGLWLKPCASVHTFFMRYPIDLVFIDAKQNVLLCQTLAPWRFSYWVDKSASVLELPAGTLAKTGTSTNDRLEFTSLPGGQE